MTELWPSELKVKDQGRTLRITFEGGTSYEIAAELLRVESPSAEVKGHGPGQETLVFGKQLVSITGVEPIGNYAARLKFSDGHSTGLFTWTYLEKLGREQDEIWATYLEKLKEEGRTREP
ncbi:gamma-butyrobetaine hydroxylase-like domain-containing protein [Aestuariivirga litoralis]|uniref:gamma-butyrobetaine hydroxylase-like domain-containing protein n=1 Tax=Aestuariivirga litoralis TaxID=2650924 RepID=UPI0018C66168|nr:DUF971 domain-containing protein [Aestuariivirga litoralis]MBG1233752.1 DUF971 domain-containing protein [Aestuariivirga litoralis]